MTTSKLLAPADNATPVSLDAMHQHFLAILPRIKTHARLYFRFISCPGRRADDRPRAPMTLGGNLWCATGVCSTMAA